MKHGHKYFALGIIVVLLVILIFSSLLGVNFVIHRVQPKQSGHSKTVFKEGATINVHDAITGEIEYSSEDAATAINEALNALNGGGVVTIGRGSYALTAPIALKRFMILSGEGYDTQLYASGDNNLINIEDMTTGNEGMFSIRDLRLTLPGNHSGHGIFAGSLSMNRDGEISNVRIEGVDSSHWCIYLNNPHSVTLRNIFANTNGNGIRFGQTSKTVNFGNSFIYQTFVFLKTHNTVAYEFSGSDASGSGMMNLVEGHRLQAIPDTGVRGTTGIRINNAMFIQLDGLDLEGSDTGVSLENASQDIELYGLYIWNTAIHGVHLGQGCKSLKIIGGHIEANSGYLYLDSNTVGQSNYPISWIIGTTLRGSAGLDLGATTRIQHSDMNNKPFENNILSNPFPIDSTGLRKITVAHRLAYTPALQDIVLTVVKNTDVSDWAFSLLQVYSVNATHVVARINVSTASGTVGATARLAFMIVKHG